MGFFIWEVSAHDVKKLGIDIMNNNF